MADTPRIHQPHGNPPPSPASAPFDPSPQRLRISLIKGDQRWHFRWEPGHEELLINSIANLARDPTVPFDWFDAAVVCKHIAQPFGPGCSSETEN